MKSYFRSLILFCSSEVENFLVYKLQLDITLYFPGCPIFPPECGVEWFEPEVWS